MRGLLPWIALALASPALAQESGYQALARARATVGKPALVERYGPDEVQRGELRVPAGAGPFPVAVVIHGGCWRADMETLEGTAPLADALTARGIATWNIEYRRLGDPGGGYPGTLHDIAAAVDHLARLAERHPIDLRRVTIVGHSSGAHLALWAAARGKLAPGLADAPAITPASVVAIDGPGDLATFIGTDAQACGAPAIVPFMGGTPEAQPEAYRLASPQAHLPLGVHQLLVLGELGPALQSYAEAATAAGDTVVKMAPGGADHFSLIAPNTAIGREVVAFIAAQAF